MNLGSIAGKVEVLADGNFEHHRLTEMRHSVSTDEPSVTLVGRP